MVPSTSQVQTTNQALTGGGKPSLLAFPSGSLRMHFPSDCWALGSCWGTPQRGHTASSRACQPCRRRAEPPAPLSQPRRSRAKPCPRASGSLMDPRRQKEGVRPLSAGGGVFEAATFTLLLTGAGEKTKSGEIQPQSMPAKAAYHRWRGSGPGRRVSLEWGRAGCSL